MAAASAGDKPDEAIIDAEISACQSQSAEIYAYRPKRRFTFVQSHDLGSTDKLFRESNFVMRASAIVIVILAAAAFGGVSLYREQDDRGPIATGPAPMPPDALSAAGLSPLGQMPAVLQPGQSTIQLQEQPKLPNLGLEREAAAQAMIDAAGRLGVRFNTTFVFDRCGELICHWDAGDGIALAADTYGGRMASRLSLGWNNARKSTTNRSAGKFQELCVVLVLAVRPEKTVADARAWAKKITELKGPKSKDAEFERRDGKTTWWGSRSVPDFKDFPTEAYVQCGASVAFD